MKEGLSFGELPDESLIHLFRSQRGGERQVAGGEAFREAEEIRDDAFTLRSGQRTEAAEAGEDFVEDEVHAVLTTKGGDGLHEARRLLDHAGGALDDGFEDQAGGRGGIAFEDRLQRSQRGGRVGAGDLTGALGVNRRGESLRGEEPGIEAAVELGAFADGHRPEGVAMVGTFHRNDAALGVLTDELPVLERKLQRDLHGVAAVVGVEATRQGAAGQPCEIFGQLGRDRVVQAEQGHVSDLVELLAESVVQVGVVMAVDVRPDRGVAVEVTLPFPVDQPAALAADQVQAGVVLILPHLGKRVPPEAPVGGIEGVRGGRSGCGGSRHTLCLGPSRPIVKPEVGGGLQWPRPRVLAVSGWRLAVGN